MRSLFQHLHFVLGNPSAISADWADYASGHIGSDIVSLENYDSVLFIIMTGTGGTGYSQVIVEACSDVDGNDNTAIPFWYWKTSTGDTWGDRTSATVSGFAQSATADLMYAVEVNSSELTATYKFVRVYLTETNSAAVSGAILAILGNPRYTKEVMPTAIV